MIVSHRHRFIFIKTRKTAGTSIEAFLARHCGPDDVLTPLAPPVPGHRRQNDEGLWMPLPELVEAAAHGDGAGLRSSLGQWRARKRFFKHMPARILRQRVPRAIWHGYTTFCVERNPFDKTLSHYHMLRARGEVDSLSAYLERGDFCLNAPLYTDRAGRLIVDRVLSYERLDEEFGTLMEALGIPFPGQLGILAKASYRQDRRPYAEVFSTAQRQHLERAFAQEISLHGYRF